jgi:hypothetical protein
MLALFNFMRSKVVQVVGILGLAIITFAKLRADTREDAKQDLTRELEKADEERADAIRKRADAVPSRVRPAGTDTRGYRD